MRKIFIIILCVSIFACKSHNRANKKQQDSIKTTLQKITKTDSAKSPKSATIDIKILNEAIPRNKGKFDVAGFENDTDAYIFIRKIRAYVNDKYKLAELISYPIYATINKKRTKIVDEKFFIDNYKQIFNKKVKNAVNNLNYNNLFANYQGVMIKDGEIWISIVNNKTKIIAINN